MYRLRYDSIIYFIASANYTQVLMTGGEMRLFTMQLGQVEREIASQLGVYSKFFVRIGKSLIVNRDCIFCINVTQQQLVLIDAGSGKYTVQASREALKQLKTLIERENEGA